MSWIEKLLPPRIQRNEGTQRRIPEGLWVKCPACESVLYKTDLEQNCMVCPKCDHHMRMSARQRIDALLDSEGRYEIAQDTLPLDTLKFKDSKRYPDRLKEALESTGETDALVVMGGAIHTVPVVAAVFEFGFMGGSMGSVVGERFARGVQTAIEQKRAVHLRDRDRRRAHAGRPAVADADGQDDRHADEAVRGEAAVRQRADRSDDGRRVGQLRVHGRRRDGRAERADRLRRVRA